MQGSDTPPGRICRKIHVMVDGVSVHVTEKTAEKKEKQIQKTCTCVKHAFKSTCSAAKLKPSLIYMLNWSSIAILVMGVGVLICKSHSVLFGPLSSILCYSG